MMTSLFSRPPDVPNDLSPTTRLAGTTTRLRAMTGRSIDVGDHPILLAPMPPATDSRLDFGNTRREIQKKHDGPSHIRELKLN